MSFTVQQWAALSDHAHDNGLRFIMSPFSTYAVARLSCCVDAWKVASGEVTHFDLLNAIRHDGKPVILSTGFSTEVEIDKASHYLNPKERGDLTILQCTTQYPCPFERIGLQWVWQFSNHTIVEGGLSDHSGTIFPGIAAATLGASMVEVHVCWDKRQFGVDASSSLPISELSRLTYGVDAVAKMWTPVDKDALAGELPDVSAYVDGKKRGEIDIYG